MDRNIYIFSVFLLAIILIACNNMQKKEAKVDTAILKQPPFAELTDSIQSFPADALRYLQRAELLSQKSLHDLAEADYKKAWTLEPSEATSMAYANSLFMVNKVADAEKILINCIQQYPDNNEFKRKLGEAYLQLGREKEAMEQFEKILSLDSNNFEAWYEKGSLLAQLKDTSGAIAAFENSFNIAPTQLSGIALANLYAETKNPKAIALCDLLMNKDSSNVMIDALFVKGVYYSNTKNYSLALEQFDACIRSDWKFNEAYIEKGIVFFEQKNIDEALRTFKLALTVSNANPDGYFWMGRCYEALNKKEEAANYYLRAFSLDRSFIEAKEALDRVKN